MKTWASVLVIFILALGLAACADTSDPGTKICRPAAHEPKEATPEPSITWA